MPFSTMVFPLRGVGVVSLYGRVDAADIIDAMTSLTEMAEWRAGYDTLWDGRRIDELHVSPDDADAIVATSFERLPVMGPGRAAFVVPREVDYLFIEMLLHRTQSKQRPQRSFRTMESALAWLDLNPHLSVLVADESKAEHNPT